MFVDKTVFAPKKSLARLFLMVNMFLPILAPSLWAQDQSNPSSYDTGAPSLDSPEMDSNDSEEPGYKKKSNPEKNYLEMAVNYINEKNYTLARRYLQLAQTSGDERIYQDALIWSMYIDALEGKKTAEAGLNALTGESNAKALYFVSDALQTYFEKNPEAKDAYATSIEYKERLIAQYENSDWSLLASMQLVPLFINEKNYDKALLYLIKYLNAKNRNNQNSGNDDKAWYYMGEILENSREYRDLHKALKSYRKVLKNPDSIFYGQAKARISAIEKFYHILP